MKKIALLLLVLLHQFVSFGQCTVSSLNISTGYDPHTGSLTTPPVLDPKWTSTISTAAATAVAGDGNTLGCYDIIPNGLWPTSGSSCNWMSAQDFWGYTTLGPGPDIYFMTVSRSFNLCSSDSLVLNLNIESDDWLSNMYFDGTPIYTLGSTPCGVTSFITYAINLGMVSPGGHTLSIEVHNCNNGTYLNAIGLALNGTVSSVAGNSSLISESDTSCLRVSSILDTNICPGATLTLSASTAGLRYFWNTGATTSSITATTPGTYWVEVFDTSCRVRIDSMYISGNFIDTTFRGHDTSVCATAVPLTLYAPSGSTTHYWNTGSLAYAINVSTSGTYIVISSPNCTSAFIDTYNVVVNPILIVNLGNDTSICSASPITLTSSQPTGTSFIWSTGNTTNSISVSTTGTYWLSVNNGCMASDTVRITVNPSPIVNLGPDAGICNYDSIRIGRPRIAGEAYLWNTGSTNDSITISSSGTYWLSVSNMFCRSTDTFHLAVNPQPLVNLGPDTSNCSGMGIVLSPSVSTAGSYLWSTGSTSSTITATSTGDYWVKLSIGSCSTTDTIHVTIQYDTVRILNNDTAICKGKVVQLLANINPDATCQWLPTAGIAISNVPNAFVTPDTSAQYILSVFMTGCPPKMDTVFIDVQPNPVVYVGGNRFVCQFDTIHISASVSPAWYNAYTYSWTPATFLDFTNTPTVVFTAGSTQNYIVAVSTSAGCIGFDSAQIIVNPGNFMNPIPDVSLCPHDSVQLIAGGGNTFEWHPGIYLSDSLSATPWVYPIASRDYTVYGRSIAGCKDTVQLHINVFPSALISIEDSVVIYPGEFYQMQPQSNCNIFKWYPPAGLSSDIISDPIAKPEVDTRYFVLGTTANGCKAVDSISVIVNPETLLTLPNAFTPGSGTNNVFYIIKQGVATLNYFRIFNRWGNLVFDTKNINEGWDGTFNGVLQPLGVYVYDIQAVTNTGRVFSKQGNVTLMR